MKIETTREAADAGGYEMIIVDPDAGGYRCYMPGERTETVTDPAIVVTPLQLRKALNATGLRGAVDSALAAAPVEFRDAWECSTTFHEDHPIVIAMTEAIGKTDADRLAIFALAATL